MSKQLEALAALLVKGARVTLNKFTTDGVKSLNGLVDREQLVVEVDEKGGVALIISDPKSNSEMGRRYWAMPRENEVEVKGNSFALSYGTGSKESPKIVYQYSVVPPEAASASAEKAAEAKAPAAPAPAEKPAATGDAEKSKD